LAQGLSSSPAKEAKRRASSSVPGVYNINDLGMYYSTSTSAVIIFRSHRLNSINADADFHRDTEKEGTELQIAKETQKLNWYVALS